MMGEDTMIMIGDQTDLMTGTMAHGLQSTSIERTEIPTHCPPTHFSNAHGLEVTEREATVVVLDSQENEDDEDPPGDAPPPPPNNPKHH